MFLYTYVIFESFVVVSRVPSPSKSYDIVLCDAKSGLSDVIFAIASSVTISPTFTFGLSILRVTIGISGAVADGGKNTTGQFPSSFSLFVVIPSLSVISTANLYSPGSLGRVKYTYGSEAGVYFISRILSGSSTL